MTQPQLDALRDCVAYSEYRRRIPPSEAEDLQQVLDGIELQIQSEDGE